MAERPSRTSPETPGRCNIGPVYVCKDGPVFTAAQMKQLPPEF